MTSAVVCAASSFSMSITSPADYLKDLDAEFFQGYQRLPEFDLDPVDYSEPDLESELTIESSAQGGVVEPEHDHVEPTKVLDKISSKVVMLPDFVDTDAVSYKS